MFKRTLAAAAAALMLTTGLGAAPKPLPVGVYTVDPIHSTLGFQVTHLVIATVTGKFDDFSGTITVKSRKDITVEGSAKASSVDTGNALRDADLRGTDPKKPKDNFFYCEKYPTLSFKSTKVVLDGDRLAVTGHLTIRGVTKLVTFKGTYGGYIKAPWGQQCIGAQLRTTINRQDYGLKFNAVIEAGPIVGNQVKLTLDIEANKDENKSKSKGK